MRGAFVLRLGPETQTAIGRYDGWIEEVDTGKEIRFHSADELLRFLAQRFDQALSGTPARATQDADSKRKVTISTQRRKQS